MPQTVGAILEECENVRRQLSRRRPVVGQASATTVEETMIVLLAEVVVRLGRIEVLLKRQATSSEATQL